MNQKPFIKPFINYINCMNHCKHDIKKFLRLEPPDENRSGEINVAITRRGPITLNNMDLYFNCIDAIAYYKVKSKITELFVTIINRLKNNDSVSLPSRLEPLSNFSHLNIFLDS